MFDFLTLTHFLNGLLMIGMPLALAVYLTRRFHLGWRLFWIGAATFVLSQVGHIPFNALLTLLFQRHILAFPPGDKTIYNAIVLGLSAGVFEETARYLVYRFWARDARSWHKGIMFGLGHGGAEAIILGFLVMFAFLQMVAYRSIDIATIVPASQVELARQQIAQYWSAPWYTTLYGALERAFTIPTQIALAVLVLQAFTRKQFFWYILAVLYHAVIDATSVLALPRLGAEGTEALVGGFALISLLIIFLLRKPEPPAPEDPIREPKVIGPPPLRSGTVSEEAIDRSRYE